MLVTIDTSIRTSCVRNKYWYDFHLLLMKYDCKNHYEREEEKIYIGKSPVYHIMALYACRKHRQKTKPHAYCPVEAQVSGRAALYNPHYKRDIP